MVIEQGMVNFVDDGLLFPFRLRAAVPTSPLTSCCQQGQEIVEGQVLKGFTSAPVPAAIDDSYGPEWFTWDTLLCSEAEVPPSRRKDPAVKELATALYSIPMKDIQTLPKYSSGGQEWHDVGYSRDILCGAARLQFRAIYQGRLIQATDVAYPED